MNATTSTFLLLSLPAMLVPALAAQTAAAGGAAPGRAAAAASDRGSAGPVLGAAPVGVVRGLIAQDTGGWGTVFAETPTVAMRRYFTAAFNGSWTAAMKHNADEPVLDGDPITGRQSVTRVDQQSLTGGETGAATARVTATLKVTAEGRAETETVSFDLKLENRRWKIDDITAQNRPSIRTYFRTSYGG